MLEMEHSKAAPIETASHSDELSAWLENKSASMTNTFFPMVTESASLYCASNLFMRVA